MTGPEHYREAERIVLEAQVRERLTAEVTAYAAVAQVHATLALAAMSAPGSRQAEAKPG